MPFAILAQGPRGPRERTGLVTAALGIFPLSFLFCRCVVMFVSGVRESLRCLLGHLAARAAVVSRYRPEPPPPRRGGRRAECMCLQPLGLGKSVPGELT